MRDPVPLKNGAMLSGDGASVAVAARTDRQRDQIVGRVRRPDGLPAVGELVRVFDQPAALRWSVGDRGAPTAEVLTDGMGDFVVDVDGSRTFLLQLSSADTLVAEVVQPNVKAGDRWDFDLKPAGSVVGVVESRSPHREGSLLQVAAMDNYGLFVDREHHTEADGSYRIDRLGPGEHVICVRQPGVSDRVRTVTVVPGTMQVQDFRLDSLVERGGVVLDAQTQRPLAVAQVDLDWRFRTPLTTDGAGRFTIVMEGNAAIPRLYCRSDGYATAAVDLSPALAEIIVSLERAVSVVGRISDAAGTAVAEADVSVVSFPRDLDAAVIVSKASSGLEGRFRVDGLRRVSGLTLIVAKQGFGTVVRELDTPAPADSEFRADDIVLEMSGALRGRITDKRGIGLAGFVVTLEALDRQTSPSPALINLLAWRSHMEQQVTASSGSFAFSDLQPGRYLVRARGEGDLSGASKQVEATVIAGPLSDDVNISFDRDQSISGWVRTSAGAPVVGAFLTVYSPFESRGQSVPGRTVSATDGQFAIADIPPGEYLLSVQPPRASFAHRDGEVLAGTVLSRIPAGTTGLVVVLPSASIVDGFVVGRDGEPTGGAFVLAISDGLLVDNCRTGPGGDFKLRVAGVVDLIACPFITIDTPDGAREVLDNALDHRAVRYSVAPSSRDVVLNLP